MTTTPNSVAPLLDPDQGFLLVTPEQADDFKRECRDFAEVGPRIEKYPGFGPRRIHREESYDYVFPQAGGRRIRIYQFLGEPRSHQTQAIYDRAIDLRDSIESAWMLDARYRRLRAAHGQYIQINGLLGTNEGIGKHTDFAGKAPPFPLLQCVVLLSRPNEDFAGGSLILFTRSGRTVNTQLDLGMAIGDAILFDKALYHEVEPVRKNAGGRVDRWTAVIGGRYKRPGLVRRLVYRFKGCVPHTEAPGECGSESG